MLQAVLNTTAAAVHQSYRNVILCAATRSATDVQYAKIWTMFEAEKVSGVRELWIGTLACSVRPAWLRSTLERSLNTTEENWTRGERFQLFLAVASNRPGVAVTLDVLIERWSEAQQLLGDANLISVIKKLAEQINNDALKQKV